MTKFSNNNVKWIGLILTIVLLFGGIIFFATQKGNSNLQFVKNTKATQPLTEIIFQPNDLSAELVSTYDVDILAKVNAPAGEYIDYINLKVEYDPIYLKIVKIQDGDYPGIYQNTLMLNEQKAPIGAVSVVWAPINDQGVSDATVLLGKITIEPLAKAGQGINISSLNNVDNWLSNVVETNNGKAVEVRSNGLSINGGSTDLSTKARDKSECAIDCGEGEFCVNGTCELIAYANNTQPSVLGASTNGINSCQVDNDCVKVSTTCCGCEQGGSEMAINRSNESQFYNELKCDKGDYTCLNYNLCTESVPVCENNLCTLKNSNGVVLGTSEEIYDMNDLNRDGSIDLLDLNQLTSDIKICERSDTCIKRSDLNNDGEVTVADFYYFVEYYSN